ncbi:MULE transposase domain containing protein [Nitzschia inconspicua]|uniref:MULE transposase domain containing protein n=1 Tax=Nitzschia inconspicua TaxID=303405 RepID=A0A9K3LCP1_9STRA|nr:MULE transposase domain containing protein [Nitzschia inconspicua]
MDNYFTTQFIEVPKEFEDMSKVELAIDDYEESSGVRLGHEALDRGFIFVLPMWAVASGPYLAEEGDGEDAEGWKWFLELLVQAVPLLKMQHPDNHCKFCYFTFISDRQKGLIQALQQVFPDNHHCFCCVHITRNVEKDVGKQVAKHVYALSATISKRESDELMAKINAISVRRKKYLEGISANHGGGAPLGWMTQPFHPGLAL